MPSAHPNRFGHTFRKGQIVKDHRGYTFRYVKLAPWDDFSRAYGRQAIVCWDTSGPLTEDGEIGYHDLTLYYEGQPVASASLSGIVDADDGYRASVVASLASEAAREAGLSLHVVSRRVVDVP